MQQLEVTVGIGGAAGDGSGATGDNLAKVCSRLGLHVFAYNSYQSLVRGGHVWLRLRIGAQKVMTHGDHLNLLIGLNQDTLDRHAREVVPGGGILYNERLKVVQLDVDTNPLTTNAYKVLSMPTFMVFRGGEPVRSMVGARPKRRLLEELTDVL